MAGDAESDGRDGLCGLGPVRPVFLQKLAGVKSVVVALSAISCINAFVQFSYFSNVVSSIEKQLGISSSRSGLIRSSRDIGEVSVVLFIAYLGAKGHRMGLTGAATFLSGLGYVMMSMPHYLMGPYQYTAEVIDGNQTAGLCRVQNVDPPVNAGDTCGNADSGEESSLIYFLFVGMALSGLLNGALQTMGLSYMDDHAPPKSAPLYLGIIQGPAVAVGTVTGVLLASVFLGWYVDFDKVAPEAIVISPSDPRWLGAWWPGFILAGALAIAASVFFFCFPKSLPAPSICKNNENQNVDATEDQTGNETTGANDQHGIDTTGVNDQTGVAERGFFLQCKSLLTNVVYMLELMASVFYIAVLQGLSLFLPKILEVTLGLSTAQVSLIAGAAMIPVGMVSQLVGGFVVKKFKLSVMACMKLIIMCSVVSCLLGVLFLTSICDGPQAGNALGSCGASCACSENDFNLVCGADGRTYYSACAAGCVAVNSTETSILNYTSCTCIDGGAWATQGPCDWSCESGFQFPLVILIAVLVNGFIGFMSPLMYQVYVRQVERDEKSLALSIRHLVQRLLASFPAPVLFGAVVDSTCVLWERECGERKACWIYDNRNMMYGVVGLLSGLKLAESIFHILAWLAMRRKIISRKTETAGKRTNGGAINEGFESTHM